MTFDEITEGLKKLLLDNHYNPSTIKFYEREWNKILQFIINEYGDTNYDMERGLLYLEKQYGFISKYNDGSISQQRVQLLRVVHMLEDYRLHQVITRRYYANKNPITLYSEYLDIHDRYIATLSDSELSTCTREHYATISKEFLDYCSQLKIALEKISYDTCTKYFNTLAGLSFKTTEQKVCGIRHLLRFLFQEEIILEDIATKIHMPNISKSAKIPSAWSIDELKAMISKIDRNNPIGKRDYAMILLAAVLGLRIGDIKSLRYSNFDWENKTLSIVQHKTHKPLTLPIPDAVGWAVIDYIKNGRPSFDESDLIFVKHMPPFDEISDNNHLENRLVFYSRKAGINHYKSRRSGFHSLRHSVGSMLLEMETPLPVITTILGHSDSNITSVYLKTDVEKLAQCILDPEDFANE